MPNKGVSLAAALCTHCKKIIRPFFAFLPTPPSRLRIASHAAQQNLGGAAGDCPGNVGLIPGPKHFLELVREKPWKMEQQKPNMNVKSQNIRGLPNAKTGAYFLQMGDSH